MNLDPISARTCFACKRMRVTPAQPGYSEYTPGSPFSAGCFKGHYEIELYEDSAHEWNEKVTRAATCADYEPANWAVSEADQP